MNQLLVAVVLAVAVPAFAAGKDYKDGLSKDEVSKLTRSLSALQGKYDEARPAIEKLKRNPDVRKNAKLTVAANRVLKHFTTIGVFLAELKAGLATRDPKVNSFEPELEGELDQWALDLAALQQQAKAAKATSLAALVAGPIVIAAALDTLWVSFDGAYAAAVADVDLVVVPVYDVYAVVHYTSPYVIVDSDDDEYVGGTDVAGYEE